MAERHLYPERYPQAIAEDEDMNSTGGKTVMHPHSGLAKVQ
jgi:hypothetical protein